ncbi:hypothetical protein ACFVAF_18050 [Streptomyces sp. NPDC057596]|uniref:hypothetical protein n=1 Tax=Streptomyces sp. NPDC057596 TaxID=3346178 RepID=UPI0036B914F7
MAAATAAEWLTAAAIGTGAFVPGALLILSLDHDLTPRLPHVDLEPARAAAERAAQRARVRLAAWLLVLAWHLEEPKGAAR